MYESRSGPNDLHMVFTAKTHHIDRAMSEVADFLTRHGPWPLFDIKLIVREALLNAVLHGGSGDGRHQVTCDLRLLDDAMECIVSDPGPGFDWTARRGRVPPLDAENGRGVCIMEAYADVMEYNTAGNVLRLVKKRDGKPGDAPHCPDEPGEAT